VQGTAPRGSLRLKLGYGGGPGMWGWAFHRISGVGVWTFILLHIFDIWLSQVNAPLYDELLQFYASLPGRMLEIVLGAGLLYHGLNGLRIILMDFFPPLTRFHAQLWAGVWILFLAIGLPVTWVILKPVFGL
jgi:succinate dehydrogenase / fumarate reductase cytochrome b subunit